MNNILENRHHSKEIASKRYSLDEWLDSALDAMVKKGPEVLTIERLCRYMGVSRGSFYWHFKDRNDFIQKLVQHWDQRLTGAIANSVQLFEGEAADKLLFLGETIIKTNAARYDIPIRSWASTDPQAAAAVRRTDKTRYEVVRSLFSEIGFTGEELEMRARTFVAFYSMERALSIKEKPEQRLRRLKLRHRLLIRRD